MPSGYEHSPDYGGPKPTWRFLLVLAAIAAILPVALFVTAARAGERDGKVVEYGVVGQFTWAALIA